MARLHLFEWEDQPWLPQALRDFITDHLQFTFSVPETAPLREAVADILAPPLKRTGETRIVDVCSGGGGPLIASLPALTKRLGTNVTVCLTDLFPNTPAFEAIERQTHGAVTGERRAVSAFDVPHDLGRFQTIFTALHHFKPEDAKRVLADAAAKGRSIVVIEPFNRKAVVVTTIAGFLLGLLRTPFMGRMTLARFLWTYPIPIAPLVLSWDGCVSCLRAYTVDELLAMGRDVAPGYKWDAGEHAVALPRATLTLTYLIGEPAALG
jgi:hypothetical protein